MRPFQGEGLDADKSWMPGAVTSLLQGSLGKIQGVEVIPVEQEPLRRSDYVITGVLRMAPSAVVCAARISPADGHPPLREVTVSEKGPKPDLFVIVGKVYNALKEEVAKAVPGASWPGSLQFQTLSLFALKYYVEAGLPGAETRKAVLYQRALSLDPLLVEAWLGLGEEHLRRGEASEAGFVVRKALRLNPGHPAGNDLLGRVHARDGDREAAEACFRKAVLADPFLLDAWRDLGRLLREEGREQEAREVYRSAGKAFGVAAGVMMPEAAFFAAPVDAAADLHAPAQTRAAGSAKAVNESRSKPPETAESSSRVASLERKLAERERQIALLQAEAARVGDLQESLERANELAAEAGRLKKSLLQAGEELESLRGVAARLRQAEEKGAVDQNRIGELEAQVRSSTAVCEAVPRLLKDLEKKDEELRLERLREVAAKAETSGAQAVLVAKLGRKVAQLTEELRKQSLEVETLRRAMCGGAEAEKAPGVPAGAGPSR